MWDVNYQDKQNSLENKNKIEQLIFLILILENYSNQNSVLLA